MTEDPEMLRVIVDTQNQLIIDLKDQIRELEELIDDIIDNKKAEGENE